MSKINHRRYPIDGQFVLYEIEMLRSPAFRELSGAEYQILFCIESELARHGGKDNGNLIVTYDACVAYGVLPRDNQDERPATIKMRMAPGVG
jgi:hypothetical protein